LRLILAGFRRRQAASQIMLDHIAQTQHTLVERIDPET
jgi:hypothetical protein